MRYGRRGSGEASKIERMQMCMHEQDQQLSMNFHTIYHLGQPGWDSGTPCAGLNTALGSYLRHGCMGWQAAAVQACHAFPVGHTCSSSSCHLTSPLIGPPPDQAPHLFFTATRRHRLSPKYISWGLYGRCGSA